MSESVSPERAEVVFNAIAGGCDCIHQVIKKTGYSYGCVFAAFHFLYRKGRIEFAGRRQNPKAGNPTKLYRVATGNPVPPLERELVLKDTKRNHWKEVKPRRTGGGGIAGPVKVGRGMRWFV